jgi:hypothetical protein
LESEEEIEIVVQENIELEIWELWKKVMENMQTEEELKKYKYI